MKEEEYLQLDTIPFNNNQLRKNWLHKSFGIMKRYNKSLTLLLEGEDLIVKESDEILEKLEANHAIELKSYGWFIINNKLQKHLK